MSLLRLLTTGKSLVGVMDTESRYRLTSQRLLPQFGPARNPFIRRGNASSAQAEGDSLEVPKADGASEQRRDIRNSCEKSAADHPSMVHNRMVSTDAGSDGLTEAIRLRAVTLLSGWRTKVTALLWRPRLKKAKPVIPRFTKQSVQGELSLDKIKVMRNDLSDADLEVVQARQPAASTSPAPAARTEARSEVGESTWGQVTTQLSGPVNTKPDEDR
jgi:hypothetical protein